jgi:molybdopterin converting factor small subunit
MEYGCSRKGEGMGVLVSVPVPFRSCTDGRTEVTVEGNTVHQVLENLNAIHAGVMAKICDENGKPRRFVNLYLNQRDIRSLDNLATKVRDGDKIAILPIAAGG